jgi:hypothetical protein
VELIDVFVTLADLAGSSNFALQCTIPLALPACTQSKPVSYQHYVTGAPMASLPSQLEGKTLAPLLAGAPASGSAVAFTIYPRWREYDDHTNCFKSYSQIEAIGLSVRTATFRLTDWTAWNASFNKPGTLRSSPIILCSN